MKFIQHSGAVAVTAPSQPLPMYFLPPGFKTSIPIPVLLDEAFLQLCSHNVFTPTVTSFNFSHRMRVDCVASFHSFHGITSNNTWATHHAQHPHPFIQPTGRNVTLKTFFSLLINLPLSWLTLNPSSLQSPLPGHWLDLEGTPHMSKTWKMRHTDVISSSTLKQGR